MDQELFSLSPDSSLTPLSVFISTAALDNALKVLADAGKVEEGSEERETVAEAMIKAVTAGMDAEDIKVQEV